MMDQWMKDLGKYREDGEAIDAVAKAGCVRVRCVPCVDMDIRTRESDYSRYLLLNERDAGER